MRGGFVAGFVLGLLVGTGLALVAMARSGAEAIELLARRAERLRERTDTLIGQARPADEPENAAASAATPENGDGNVHGPSTAGGMR